MRSHFRLFQKCDHEPRLSKLANSTIAAQMDPGFAPKRIIASDVVFPMLPVVLVRTLEHLAWQRKRLGLAVDNMAMTQLPFSRLHSSSV